VEVEPLIDAQRVEEILIDCLGGENYDIAVEGVINTYGFSGPKLEEHTEEIRKMLWNLPKPFLPTAAGGGGGWSFLNACQDANDEQWTGLHQRMEQLLCLGIAMGLAEWVLPKDMWPALPGGMPYVVVKV
jgi:hypothetical protein